MENLKLSDYNGNIQSVSDVFLHRAPWVITVSQNHSRFSQLADADFDESYIEDGCVCSCNGRILDVGRYKDLRNEYSGGMLVDHECCILTPSLVNGHTHLELSHLLKLGKSPGIKTSLPTWIRTLITKRQESALPESDIIKAGRLALDQMHSGGIGLVGDIGNRESSRKIAYGSKTDVVFFLELFGMSKDAEKRVLKRLDHEISEDFVCTAHAPYSTSAELIRLLKSKANEQQAVFSIHVAESVDELEFLRYGSGEFSELLVEKGVIDRSFSPVIQKGMGSVHYLDSLGVLDEKTMCVHAVHLEPSEIEMLSNRNCKVCLCPGSNRYLGVGKAPVAFFLANGILPALGTDSLASNPEVSIWQEMQHIRHEHFEINPAVVFAMGTVGGAEALGLGKELGSLEPGKRASFLAVHYEENSAKNIFEFLTTIGNGVRLSWISESYNEEKS